MAGSNAKLTALLSLFCMIFNSSAVVCHFCLNNLKYKKNNLILFGTEVNRWISIRCLRNVQGDEGQCHPGDPESGQSARYGVSRRRNPRAGQLSLDLIPVC
jgi:hypothetical protein